MSVVGSLMWIASSCRPGIAYSVSKLQSCMNNAVVEDLFLANKVVKHVHEHPKRGITYKPSVPWLDTKGRQKDL
eukprot:1688062-Amphidinium_carterae.1